MSHHRPSLNPAPMRQLKVLLWVLVTSNIAVGLYSMYALRTLDRQYSELIDQTVPLLGDLQALTAKTSLAMIGTSPVRFGGADRAAAVETARRAFADEAAHRARLLSELQPDRRSESQDLRASAEAFNAAGAEYLALLDRSGLAEAGRYREVQLRPAFEHYLWSLERTSNVLKAESDRANDAVSQHAGTVSVVLFGVATWPVLVLVLLLLATALFVGVLMILFRGREMSDQP